MKRPLPTFLLTGALLAALRAWVPEAAVTSPGRTVPDRVVVEAGHLERIFRLHEQTTGREPTEAERAAMIEAEVRDRLLLRAALDSGLDRIDPRISWRLMEKMRFLGKADESDPAATVRRARELGLQEHDTVIERMLIEKMGTLARYQARQQEDVGDEELEAFFREHAERWVQPRRTTFRHLFFTGEREEARRAARRALDTITGAGRDDDPEVSMGMPFVAGPRLAGADDATLAKLFGGEFAEVLATLPVGVWRGPVPSSSGWHLVLVEQREAQRPAELAEVRSQVLAAFQAEWGDRGLEQRVEELGRLYEVSIELPAAARSARRTSPGGRGA